MQLLKSYSWVILSENIAYKVADKTLIQDKETGIPLDITPFFTNKQLEAGEELKSIKFLIDNQEQAISLKRKKDGRYKIVL